MTLIELLIVVVLLSLISLGFFNLHIFSQEQVFQADRRAKVQNEISFILEHMTKHVKGTAWHGGAIGDINNLPITLVAGGGGVTQIQIRTDWNNNGRLDTPAGGGADTDKTIIYEYDNHNIRFYPNFEDSPGASEVLTNLAVIIGPFNAGGPTTVAYTIGDNFFDIQISGCWDPTQPALPVLENPHVTMTATINMPAVSVN